MSIAVEKTVFTSFEFNGDYLVYSDSSKSSIAYYLIVIFTLFRRDFLLANSGS